MKTIDSEVCIHPDKLPAIGLHGIAAVVGAAKMDICPACVMVALLSAAAACAVVGNDGPTKPTKEDVLEIFSAMLDSTAKADLDTVRKEYRAAYDLGERAVQFGRFAERMREAINVDWPITKEKLN